LMVTGNPNVLYSVLATTLCTPSEME